MVILKVTRHSERDSEYLLNALSYVEDRERAICRGAYGVEPYTPAYSYHQMMAVKYYFSKTSGNPLIHFVVSYDDSVDDPFQAIDISKKLASIFAEEYQVVWCLHMVKRGHSRFHTHIVLNSVNYKNGMMYHSGPKELNDFAQYIRAVTGRSCRWTFS